MQQQCVYLHTNKNLEEVEQVLQTQGMEIILKTDSMRINYSDMTVEEQSSWVKLMTEELEESIDDYEIYLHKINLLFKNNQTLPNNLREMLEAMRNSNDSTLSQIHINLVKELHNFDHKLRHLTYFTRYRDPYVEKFGVGISCSCIIARKDQDVLRYLSFLEDPIVTINGPSANALKSILEKSL